MDAIHDASGSYRPVRWHYAADACVLASTSDHEVLGALTSASSFDVTLEQAHAWRAQLVLLREALLPFGGRGRVYLEFDIPRLGRRIDAVLLLDHVVFVIEFKVGETSITTTALDQVWDYALDLRNFHETSHDAFIAPILVATDARPSVLAIAFGAHDPQLPHPTAVGALQLGEAIQRLLDAYPAPAIHAETWERGRYRPTPTIVEAARALYANHAVEDIARSDAGARNLARTSQAVERIIGDAREHGRKSICFVTGVPGAGKTLVGLDVATRHREASSPVYSVFLSGNGPLVKVLREALARDAVRRAKAQGAKLSKKEALEKESTGRRSIKSFIQIIHAFRDDCLADPHAPPEHVALFDEAQRAWNLAQTSKFMRMKKGRPGFAQSEPEFLISCLDRHPDWAVIVCLVGSGQEINTGEAGISEWIEALLRSFPQWHAHLSPVLLHEQYRSAPQLQQLAARGAVDWVEDMHLSTSMRSFRAENVSEFVRLVLAREVEEARRVLASFWDRYPIYLTRDLSSAKRWVRERARGSERYGLLASSQAQRLKPHAIDVKSPINPVNWFLNGKHDVRSSYYLEDAATEFHVQGLEVDWACVVWDGDLRDAGDSWSHNEFRGSKWNRVKHVDRRRYLENAYRVLLTRARQGMVVVVPEGDRLDPTRRSDYYDSTFRLLRRVGVPDLGA